MSTSLNVNELNDFPSCIIMRGISGSGKSTWIKQNIPTYTVVSADLFFYDSFGSYNYDPRKIGEAHEFSKCKFIEALENNENVVVDNTNIRRWEYKLYLKLALLFQYQTKIIQIIPSSFYDISKIAKRNTHNVPEEIVGKMSATWENDPEAITIKCVL